MFKKLAVGAGAAGVLTAGVLLGGLTTGWVGAQTPPQAPAAQTAPGSAPEAPAGGEQTAPVSLPPGSVSAAQAQQAAVDYIAKTAPYSTQGLTAQAATVDDENGTVVFKVLFTGSTGPVVDVTLDAQGTVLKAEPAEAAAETADGTEAAGTETQAADGPGGHADAPGTTESQGGAQD